VPVSKRKQQPNFGGMITKLEDFKAHTLAMQVGEEVWDVVIKWGYFEKDTVGKQFVKAVDSIAANLSEGLGRYHYKEAKNFAYYSRGSLFETRTWLQKSLNRKLIEEEKSSSIDSKLNILGKMINTYINSIGDVNEPFTPYPSSDA
jgi:four helix bundle protein